MFFVIFIFDFLLTKKNCESVHTTKRGLMIKFKSQDFPLNDLKNSRTGTLIVPAIVLPGARCVCPRPEHFSECNLPIGLTAGLQIEFLAEKFPFNFLK
jgi:hypothetical protein